MMAYTACWCWVQWFLCTFFYTTQKDGEQIPFLNLSEYTFLLIVISIDENGWLNEWLNAGIQVGVVLQPDKSRNF
jgi:hypothetical protein